MFGPWSCLRHLQTEHTENCSWLSTQLVSFLHNLEDIPSKPHVAGEQKWASFTCIMHFLSGEGIGEERDEIDICLHFPGEAAAWVVFVSVVTVY